MSALKSEAFYGAEFVRTEVLDGLQGGERAGTLMRLWLAGRSHEARYDVIAAEFGLDASLVRLVSALGGDPLDSDVQRFVFDLIKAVPTGAPIDNVVSDWMIWTWDHGFVSLLERLRGSEAEAPAQAIIDLIRTNRTDPVDAGLFRQARNAARRATAASPTLSSYGEVLQAMAWDSKRLPGVILDVVSAWTQALRQESLRNSGWTEEMERELDALRTGIFDTAAAEVKAAGLTEREEMIRLLRKLEAEAWERSGKEALRDQNQSCRFVANAHIAQWVESARLALIEQVKAAG